MTQGTDDENSQPIYNRIPLRSRVDGRSMVASAPYQRMQTDFESDIHSLEQIAYGAVLRAFKAQSDALTWEKEGLITELRKELRVSDDEHRELLTEVNADDLIRKIREWREAGGNRNMGPNAPQHVQSPTVPGSRKRHKPSQNPFGAVSQPIHPQTVPGTNLAKWGPGRRSNGVQPAFAPAKPVQYQFTDRVSSGAPTVDPSESTRDTLVGRRVMIRWPADNNFYEAVITEYNPIDGRHSLVYDSNTSKATLEWVNIKEFPTEDIRWVGDDPVVSRLGEPGGPNPGRARSSSKKKSANGNQPSLNGAVTDDYEEIEILHTDTLIKKVEKVLDATHPDILEIDKAKKILKEHEQTLIQVIQKLASACESDDDHPSVHGHSGGRPHNVDYHEPSQELDIVGSI